MALTPKIAVENYLAAKRELTETFAEVLKLKLDEQLILGKLEPRDLKEDWYFDEEESDVGNEVYAFSYLTWDQSATVRITRDFIVDPMSFIEAANVKIKADMEAKIAKRKEDRAAKVVRLEKELAEAKRVAELNN